MNTNIFVAFILLLTCSITYFYAELREHFSPLHRVEQKLAISENKLKHEKFKHLLTSYEFADFKEHVATILPEAIQQKGAGEKSFQLRTLASVVQKESSEKLALTRAKLLFEEGKNLFRSNKFDLADMKLREVLKKHPYSPYIPETLFLLIETSFIQKNYDASISYANKMIDLYPENELTGYAMLRLGKIYELEDRHDDAIDIYKTVLKVFPDRNLASAAATHLRKVQL